MKYIIILLTSLFLVSNAFAENKWNEWVVVDILVYSNGDDPDVTVAFHKNRKECEDHVMLFANDDDYKKRGVVLSYDHRQRPYLRVAHSFNNRDINYMYCKPAF